MKNFILALVLITPLSARAGVSSIHCASEGSGGDLAISLYSQNGLDVAGSRLSIYAKGILTSEFLATVDKVAIADDGALVLAVTTLDANGNVTPDSGTATIRLGAHPGPYVRRYPSGTGAIDLTQLPKVKPPLRLQPHYDLHDCTGVI